MESRAKALFHHVDVDSGACKDSNCCSLAVCLQDDGQPYEPAFAYLGCQAWLYARMAGSLFGFGSAMCCLVFGGGIWQAAKQHWPNLIVTSSAG